MVTKSGLQAFRQCPRKLWLEHQRLDLIFTGDPTLNRRTTDGNIVGTQAPQQLGPDVIWSPAGEDEAAAAKRALLLLKKSRRKPAAEVPTPGQWSRWRTFWRGPVGHVDRRGCKFES